MANDSECVRACMKCVKNPHKYGMCRYHYNCWLFGERTYKGKSEYKLGEPLQKEIKIGRDKYEYD